jgi:hypothetical protein
MLRIVNFFIGDLLNLDTSVMSFLCMNIFAKLGNGIKGREVILFSYSSMIVSSWHYESYRLVISMILFLLSLRNLSSGSLSIGIEVT